MSPDYDALIIGAGAAGLAAGRELARAGRRVAILEARDRVGGRIHTQTVVREPAGEPIQVELGAEFIHGLPRATWSLVEEAKLATHELAGASLSFDAGSWPPQREPAWHDVLEGMIRWLAAQPPAHDMSFADYLTARPVDAASAKAAANYVEGFNAADRRRIGIASLAKQQTAEDAIDADRLFRVAAGYEAIPKFLSAEFHCAGGHLVLGAAASAIAWRRGRVAVHVRDAAGAVREFNARRVLITVPLGVLQAGNIEFTPRPTETLAQPRRLAMGEVARVILIFRERFWSELRGSSIPPHVQHELRDLSFLFAPSEVPPTWWTPRPEPTPMLTAWVGGPKAAALQRATASSPDALRERCLATLARIFEIPLPHLQSLLVSWHTHDWSADPYARGAYSYVPAGALDAPERLTRPIEDTLYFAGEHTDTTGHWGTVHAALGSGMRAAAQMLCP